MTKVVSKIEKVLEIIFGLVGIAMIFVASYGVLARNVLHISTPWTDELLKLLFIWSVFVCSGIAFAKNELISLTLMEDGKKAKSTPVFYGILKLIQYVGALIVGALLSSQMLTIVSTQIKTGEATTVMKYPFWIRNLGILIGMIMITVAAVIKLIECMKYFKKDAKVE